MDLKTLRGLIERAAAGDRQGLVAAIWAFVPLDFDARGRATLERLIGGPPEQPCPVRVVPAGVQGSVTPAMGVLLQNARELKVLLAALEAGEAQKAGEVVERLATAFERRGHLAVAEGFRLVLGQEADVLR